MVKGKKPHSQALKRINGAFAHDPQRENKREPIVPDGVPAKPEHIAADPIVNSYWDHAVHQLSEMKLLTKADRSILEGYAVGMAFRQRMAIERNLNEWVKANKECMRCMAEVGLTPSARSRMVVKSKEEEDAFSQWQKGFEKNSDN